MTFMSLKSSDEVAYPHTRRSINLTICTWCIHVLGFHVNDAFLQVARPSQTPRGQSPARVRLRLVGLLAKASDATLAMSSSRLGLRICALWKVTNHNTRGTAICFMISRFKLKTSISYVFMQ